MAIDVLNPNDEFDLCPYAKIGNTIVFCLQFCELRVRKRKKTECDYFLKEREMWYETDAVVLICSVTKLWFDCLRCPVLWCWSWPVKDWKRFSSCLLYTCETAYYNTRRKRSSVPDYGSTVAETTESKASTELVEMFIQINNINIVLV